MMISRSLRPVISTLNSRTRLPRPCPSPGFSRKNINCGIAESLDRFRPVAAAARDQGIRVRGYVSCVLGCPYEGEIAVDAVAAVATALALAEPDGAMIVKVVPPNVMVVPPGALSPPEPPRPGWPPARARR